MISRGRRILLVAPSLPHPPIWGFGIRVHQIARNLAGSHRVSLLAYAGEDDQEKVEALREFCEEVHIVSLDAPLHISDRRQQFASLFSLSSYHKRRLRSPRMADALDELLSHEEYDIIQIESSPMADFEFGRNGIVVLDEHNIEYELLQRTYQTEPNLPRKAFGWLEYQKFKREEQRSWSAIDGCVVTSDREKQIVDGILPRLPSAVVPNGVDVGYFSPRDSSPDGRAQNLKLVFTGLVRYRPNADAIVHFVSNVLPLIHRRRPDVIFTIVGWGVPPEVQRVLGPKVIATERVPDVRPYLADAAVVVVPLRMGSGTRLKVLEAMAMGRPIVSTAVGCEGIPAMDGEHLLIRNDPEAFAHGVLDLLDDPAQASRLGRSGRQLVERQFAWESVVAGLDRFHECLLQRSEVGGGLAARAAAPASR